MTKTDKTKKPPALRLHAAYLAISGSMADQEIGKMMEGYGYPRTKLDEGKKLYDAVVAANADLIIAKGSKHEATARTAKAKKAAKDAYRLFAQTIKGFFGKATLASIGLTDPIPLAKTCALFDNALKMPEILAKLTECGYDPAKLQAERGKIIAYEQADQACYAAVDRALSAERVRNGKLTVLETWLASYLMVAEVALRERGDLRRKIGIMSSALQTETRQAAGIVAKAATI